MLILPRRRWRVALVVGTIAAVIAFPIGWWRGNLPIRAHGSSISQAIYRDPDGNYVFGDAAAEGRLDLMYQGPYMASVHVSYHGRWSHARTVVTMQIGNDIWTRAGQPRPAGALQAMADAAATNIPKQFPKYRDIAVLAGNPNSEAIAYRNRLAEVTNASGLAIPVPILAALLSYTILSSIATNRKINGKCPVCAYPLENLSRCPECGTDR